MTIMVGNGNRTFSPTSRTIMRGTRVMWVWNDAEPHSTTSDTGVWDSRVRQGAGQEFGFTFDQAGTFPYHCLVHGAAGGIGMSGTITVTQ